MDEERLIDKIRGASNFHARSLVAVVRAVEERYGEEGKTAVKKAWLDQVFYRPWKKLGESIEANDVQSLAKLLEEQCIITHEWKRIIDEPDKVGYRFTKCEWAKTFKELGATDIGKWFCDSDPVFVEAFNPDMRFKRTKTLMDGCEYCDHIFYM